MIFNYLSNIVQGKYQAWKNKRTLTSVLMDSQPVFSSFGTDVYMSDLVNNCIDRIATEISKIDIRSVVERGSRIAVQNDDITRLFRFKPNPLQTTKDFLACCEWLRRKDMHCFIFPQWELVTDAQGNEYRRYTALYPLNPQSIEMGTDEFGTWVIKFRWRDGSEDAMPYSDIIHLKWRRGKNTIVGGGDDYGNADTRNILSSVQTLDKVLQGLPIAIDASTKISGVYTAKTTADQKLLDTKRDEFESHILKSKIGIAAISLAGEFTPIKHDVPVIPDNIMKFLKDIVRERYGISAAIISGDYNDDQYAAFYESCIEDFIVELQQAASPVLFSSREQDVGHRLRCYYNKVEYFSTTNKIQLSQIARDTGLMTNNEVRDMFGLEPYDGGDRRLQSLNYVNTELVDKYQLQAKGAIIEDGQKSKTDS